MMNRWTEIYESQNDGEVAASRASDDETRRQASRTTTDKAGASTTSTFKLEEEESSSKWNANQNLDDITADSVYDFYVKELLPAIMASLPLLFHRLIADTTEVLRVVARKAFRFLLPAVADYFDREHAKPWTELAPPNLAQLWEQTIQKSAQQQSSIAEFMLRHFDSNGDGHISSSELINMTEIFSKLPNPQLLAAQAPQPQTFWSWFSREWPLMEWKLGLFLWKCFGGLLLVVAVLSIIPGRLHGISGKVLRWPILGMTYFLITVELIVYIMIRLVIRLAELIIATPKHRTLRRKLSQATSYVEWYKYAMELDASQGRDEWQRMVNDSTTCRRYNWAFVKQLLKDMRRARSKGDSLLALAVLQQCTRKNVGGVMSEDLFSFTNTGEPKEIVTEFVEEVAQTLRWITDEAISRIPPTQERQNNSLDAMDDKAKQSYAKSLERKVKNEKEKIWKSLISWATLTFNKEGDPIFERIENIQAVGSRGDTSPSSPRSGGGDINSRGAGSGGSLGCNIPGALPAFHKEQLIGFLKRARAAYGRTALCLSGGAMMGLYHFGHVVGLMETGCLPNIISGTSAGSVVGAILCTRTDDELKRDLNPEILSTKLLCFSRPWRERIPSVWKDGHMFDTDEWLSMIKWYVP